VPIKIEFFIIIIIEFNHNFIYKMNRMWLLITAQLHYYALVPLLLPYTKNLKILPFFNRLYIITIIIGTTLSLFYHYYHESTIIMILDYLVAGFWFLLDILWSALLDIKNIKYMNIVIFGLNIIFNYCGNYVFYHSIWHILSAIKCIIVSSLIYYYDYR